MSMPALNQEDRIHRALRQSPKGLTLDQLAREVGSKPKNLSSRMSKLFMYGRVNRARAMQRSGETETIYTSGDHSEKPKPENSSELNSN